MDWSKDTNNSLLSAIDVAKADRILSQLIAINGTEIGCTSRLDFRSSCSRVLAAIEVVDSGSTWISIAGGRGVWIEREVRWSWAWAF